MMDLKKLPNARPGETTALFLRRHWFAPLSIAVTGFALLAVPAAAAAVFSDSVSAWFAHPVAGPILTFGSAIYVLGVWLIVSIEFVDYYLDTWIVTTERVINIEQHGLFRRTASELHLGNVQDVTSEIKGPLHTFFNYGNVLVQTAAEKDRFNFENVPHPDRVKDQVLRLVDEDKRRHASEPQKPA